MRADFGLLSFRTDLKSLTLDFPDDPAAAHRARQLVAKNARSLEELDIEDCQPSFHLFPISFPRLNLLFLTGVLDFEDVCRLLQSVSEGPLRR